MKALLPILATPFIIVSCAQNLGSQGKPSEALKEPTPVVEEVRQLPGNDPVVNTTKSPSYNDDTAHKYAQRPPSRYGVIQDATSLPSDRQLREDKAPIATPPSNVFTPPTGG